MRNYIIYGVLAIVLLLGGYGLIKQLTLSRVDEFNITSDQLATDLNGQMVGLPYGQAWPFDASQRVQVNVINKKAVDQFIVVFASVQAQADVTPVKSKDDKEPPKEAPKEPKLPKRVALSGVLKMHYEQIGGQWYLVLLEGVGMKAVPLPD